MFRCRVRRWSLKRSERSLILLRLILPPWGSLQAALSYQTEPVVQFTTTNIVHRSAPT